MNTPALTALIVSGIALLGAMWAVIRTRETAADVATAIAARTPAGPPGPADAPGPDQWIRSETKNPHVTWGQVVAEFYGHLLQDREIADYFPAAVDMRELQDHFAKAMILVTRDGLSRGVVDALARKHARVVNGRGEPITPAIYDRVVDTLVRVLQRRGVPQASIAQLGKTIAPLRAAIVGVSDVA